MGSGKVVFGGVTSWAFANNMLNDTDKGLEKGIYASTYRPLSPEKTLWPRDDRLVVTSGIDLLGDSQQEVQTKLVGTLGKEEFKYAIYLGMLPESIQSLPWIQD